MEVNGVAINKFLKLLSGLLFNINRITSLGQGGNFFREDNGVAINKFSKLLS